MSTKGNPETGRRRREEYVLIPRHAGVRLRTIQLPGEPEPIPQVFRCPSCGDDKRLVMLAIETASVEDRIQLRKQGKKPKELQFLLSLGRREAAQLLAEFKHRPLA